MRTLRELKQALNQPLADTAWQTPGWNLPYAVNAAVSQKKLNELGNLGERVVVYEPIALWKRVKGGMEPGRAVLFADGHVKFLSQPEWDAAKKASLLPEAPAPEVAPWWHLAAAGPREPISDSRAALLWGGGYILLALLAALLRRQRLLTGAVLFTLLGGLLGIGGFLLVVNGVRRGPGL